MRSLLRLALLERTLQACCAAPSSYYVDCGGGNDANPGTVSAPFKTPNHARDVVRSSQPLQATVTVYISGDCFSEDRAVPVLSLGPGDSGASAAAQVVYEALPSGARFLGGVSVSPDVWQPAPDIGDGVLQTALTAPALGLNASDIGQLAAGGLGQCSLDVMEIFCGGSPMTLARYPNPDPDGKWRQWLNIANVTGPLSFIVDDLRPLRWNPISAGGSEPEPWLGGYWAFDWAFSLVRVTNVSALPGGKSVEITLDASTPVLYQLTQGARFFGLNLLSELDIPTEYYLNRSNALAFFYPPGPLAAVETFMSLVPTLVSIDASNPATEGQTAAVGARTTGPHDHSGAGTLPRYMAHVHPPSSAAGFVRRAGLAFPDEAAAGRGSGESAAKTSSLVAGSQLAAGAPAPAVSFVTLRGISVQFARQTAVVVNGGVSVVLDRLNISNHGRSALILEGSNSTVSNSFAAGLGCSAMDISGGDETTLARGNNLVVNNTIERYAQIIRTYTPAIGWSGVGNTYSGNTIGNAPQCGELMCYCGWGGGSVSWNRIVPSECRRAVRVVQQKAPLT